MKIASLLVPAYLPAAFVGATPTPYQSGTVDKFERELAALSPLVVRHSNDTRLSPDPAGRFVHQQIVTPYSLMVDDAEGLGVIVTLAQKTFGLDKLAVVFGGKFEDITKDGAEELVTGLHIWNEEA